jgi:hypothetical protein
VDFCLAVNNNWLLIVSADCLFYHLYNIYCIIYIVLSYYV